MLLNENSVNVAKDKLKREKENLKMKELEGKIALIEQKRKKKEWKKNFVTFVNTNILLPYRKINIFPSMGDHLFIDTDKIGEDNIYGMVDDRYFFTYLEGRSTVLVVFEADKNIIKSHDGTLSEEVECYKAKSVKFGVVGLPVTSSVKFDIINSKEYSQNETLPNEIYDQFNNRKVSIDMSKKRYLEYMRKK